MAMFVSGPEAGYFFRSLNALLMLPRRMLVWFHRATMSYEMRDGDFPLARYQELMGSNASYKLVR